MAVSSQAYWLLLNACKRTSALIDLLRMTNFYRALYVLRNARPLSQICLRVSSAADQSVCCCSVLDDTSPNGAIGCTVPGHAGGGNIPAKSSCDASWTSVYPSVVHATMKAEGDLTIVKENCKMLTLCRVVVLSSR